MKSKFSYKFKFLFFLFLLMLATCGSLTICLRTNFSAQKLILICIGLSLFLSFLTFIFFIRFFNSFSSIIKSMKNVSEGAKNLSARLKNPGSPELTALTDSCNKVIENMQNTMQTISSSIEAMNSNSTKIFDQTKQLSDLIGNVSGNVNDVQSKATSQTNLITSLESNTHDLQDSMIILNEKITEQTKTVADSIQVIESIIKNINGADNQINHISNEYQLIVDETKTNEKKQNNMTEKIKFIAQQAENLSIANAVITGITSKTNLLAMNAAIEASHAGEAGKGFSVVAGEIRALAENSSKQTQTITNLVTEIDDAIKQIVIASDDSEKAFSSLGHKIENLSASLSSIKQNMNEQNQNATNVTAMLEVLNESTGAISLASETINENTQTVAKGINTMKFSIRRINETSESAQSLLGEMSSFANDTNTSSENNKKAVDDINKLVDSYQF